MSRILFPKDFLFGGGISDYQHFGGTKCDLPEIPAAKHAQYFEDDFRILEELGLNAFRTTIEWARIEPSEGKIDKESVEFYHEYFSRLKKIGITTIVTLHHFTNPKWIHKYGGWLSEKTVTKFLEYVDFVCQEFRKYIDYYLTINEPTIYTQLAYLSGSNGLPPYRKNAKEARRCLRNLDEAILKSYEIIHKAGEAKVGVAHDFSPLSLALQDGKNLFSWLLQKISWNPRYANHVKNWENKFDFCGVNYYCKTFLGKTLPNPEGLRKICKYIFEKYRKPILITENGLPNRNDAQKSAYLMLHLKSLADSMMLDETEIIGYCWWSFLHGYEWRLGYKPFFALVDVDIDRKYKRTPTQTAYIYSDVIKNRGFSPEQFKESQRLEPSLKFEDWP